MKLKTSLILILLSTFIYAQKHPNPKEDFNYEIKHKSKAWFANMKDGADYFEVKKSFDTYFSNRQWEKSKPRALCESWLKSKLYYLDAQGIVQPEPFIQGLHKDYPLLNSFQSSTTDQIGSWEILGPVNSATTNYSGSGNHGGYVFLNRIDPTDTSKHFVSFLTGGLWVTLDGGDSWTLVDSNLPDEKYHDLDIAVSNPQIVYAISDLQVIKSIDGGLNWSTTTLTQSNYSGKAYDIAVSTSNPDIVVARWGDKIYRTTDGGTTWDTVLSGLSNHQVWDSSIHSEMLDWSTTDSNVAYALSTSHNNSIQLYRSDNSGASFAQIATLTLDPSANGQVVGWGKLLLPSTNNEFIYVAVGSGDTAYAHRAAHLYKVNATTGEIVEVKTNMITGIGNAYNHDPVLHHGDISMDRNDENIIIYGSYGNSRVHVSTDNGNSFTVSEGITHTDIRTIDVVNDIYLVGTDGETVKSTDNGATLNTLTNSIGNHELWGFGSAFKTNLVASGNNHGPVMIKEAAFGYDWYNGSGADQGNTDVNPLDDRYIYSQGYSNYRYFRTGPHTLINEANLLDLGGIYSYFNSIEFHPNKYYTIITHHAGHYPVGNPNLDIWKKSLIKTEDNGNTISIVKTFDNQVFREKISMKNPQHIYVVEGLTNNKLWHTSDAGVTWTDITPGPGVTSGQTNISDIAVSDEHPNEIWVTYSGVQSVCKVLKSNDYGNTWTNLTQPVLTDFPLTKIIFQRGSDGGVYVGNKSGVYYRNNTMNNWELLGNGLPMCEIRFMFINYNENKLKIGTSRGAFAHDLFEISPPNALISANTSKITCPVVEKVHFKDYSVIRNSSATWSWSFPGGNPSTSNEENPIVSYENAPDGFYDVTLTITDAYGTSTQTLTNFIEVANQCGTSIPDPVPGNLATLSGSENGDYLKVDNLNLTKDSFTFSCWIKPNGIQDDYSAIFNTQDDNSAFALNFVGGDNSIGFHPTWGWNSGLQAPPDQWSHVAITSDGEQVKIYVNGIESTHNTALPAELFTTIDIGRYGRGYSSRYTNLEIDEVCIWNRALTKDEIRKSRHLTKSNPSDPLISGLVAYYQFNESGGNVSVNKTEYSNYASYQGISGSVHNPSSVPVFEGESQKINISSPGVKDFDTVGLSMTFGEGTYPDGDVWVSRGQINPDVLPDDVLNFHSYTIVNNYGENMTFTPLEAISFTGNPEYIDSPAADYNLYKRESNAFGDTWGTKIDTGDDISGTGGAETVISFSTALMIDSFSQFVLTNENTISIDEVIINDVPIISPNPLSIHDTLSVLIPEDWGSTTMIVYDMKGQKTNQTTLVEGENLIKLNVSSGIHMVLIFNSKHKFTKKLLISR